MTSLSKLEVSNAIRLSVLIGIKTIQDAHETFSKAFIPTIQPNPGRLGGIQPLILHDDPRIRDHPLNRQESTRSGYNPK